MIVFVFCSFPVAKGLGFFGLGFNVRVLEALGFRGSIQKTLRLCPCTEPQTLAWLPPEVQAEAAHDLSQQGDSYQSGRVPRFI